MRMVFGSGMWVVWLVVALIGTLVGACFGHAYIGFGVGLGVMLLIIGLIWLWAMSMVWSAERFFKSISGE